MKKIWRRETLVALDELSISFDAGELNLLKVIYPN